MNRRSGELPVRIVRLARRVAPRGWDRVDALLVAGLLAGAGYCFLLDLGGYPLLMWDEAIYGTIARRMVETGEWLVPRSNYRLGLTDTSLEPFLLKPPLVFWLQALSIAVLGPSELAVRLPSATFAMATVVVVYAMGRRLYDRTAGVVAGVVFVTTPFVSHINNGARFGGTDTVMTFFGTLAVLLAWRAVAEDRPRDLVWVGVAAGFAVLAKGFAAGIFGIIALPLVVAAPRTFLSRGGLRGLAAAAAVALPWPVFAWIRYGNEFVHTILIEQVFGRVAGEMTVYGGTAFGFMKYPYFSELQYDPNWYYPWLFVLLPAATAVVAAEVSDRAGLRGRLSAVADVLTPDGAGGFTPARGDFLPRGRAGFLPPGGAGTPRSRRGGSLRSSGARTLVPGRTRGLPTGRVGRLTAGGARSLASGGARVLRADRTGDTGVGERLEGAWWSPFARRPAVFLTWWAVSVLAFFAVTGNHPWYILAMFVPTAVLVGRSVSAAARLQRSGLAVLAAGSVGAFAFDARYGTAFAVGAGAVLVGLGVLRSGRVLAPESRPGVVAGRAGTLLLVALLLSGLVAVYPMSHEFANMHVQREMGDSVDTRLPDSATVYVGDRMPVAMHTFDFYAQTRVSGTSAGEIATDADVHYALVTYSTLARVSRGYEVLDRFLLFGRSVLLVSFRVDPGGKAVPTATSRAERLARRAAASRR